MSQPSYGEIEQVLGFRERNERHRAAKKHGLPIGSGDTVPTWQELSGMLWKKMLDYAKRPESIDDASLKTEKLQGEIKVLEERYRKLEIENQIKEEHLVDIRDLTQGLSGLGQIMRETGDTLARKKTLTGRDAVELWNSGLDKYERKRKAIIENRNS